LAGQGGSFHRNAALIRKNREIVFTIPVGLPNSAEKTADGQPLSFVIRLAVSPGSKYLLKSCTQGTCCLREL